MKRRIRINMTFFTAVCFVLACAVVALPALADSEAVRTGEQDVIFTENVESRGIGPASAMGSNSFPQESRSLVQRSGESGIGLSRTFASLVVVIGIAYIGALIWKRIALRRGGLISALGAAGRAPSGVIEVLARYPVSRTQRLVLLRVGRRVLLLSQSAGARSGLGNMATLAELDDPEEIAAILSAVRHNDGESNATAFKDAMIEIDRKGELHSAESELCYATSDGDRVEWRDERIQIPSTNATDDITIDPAIGRLRARLAAMREKGTCA